MNPLAVGPAFLETEVACPEYREGNWGPWTLERKEGQMPDGSVLLAGYWSPLATFPAPYILKRDGEIWMSTTAMETESQQPFVWAAHGHSVICGLGMGIALMNIAAKPDVHRVTVVEKDPEVLGAFRHFTDASSWEGWGKVTLLEADAFDVEIDGPIDFLYMDIWPYLGQKQALEETQAVHCRLRPTSIGFWGQEFDFVAWLAREGIDPDLVSDEDWRAYRAHTTLPLVPKNVPGYANLAIDAVATQVL